MNDIHVYFSWVFPKWFLIIVATKILKLLVVLLFFILSVNFLFLLQVIFSNYFLQLLALIKKIFVDLWCFHIYVSIINK